MVPFWNHYATIFHECQAENFFESLIRVTNPALTTSNTKARMSDGVNEPSLDFIASII
jgi:hypothetical protein